MPTKIVPSIETLPVEILHRIFDNLDAETILFSIRPVCRLFRSIVNTHKTYNQYVVDMKLISKSNFYVLCRWINPENVISLSLSNDRRTSNQIRLFISLVHLRQFTQLHSLTLLQIDEAELIFILKQINLNLLTSFSFSIRKYDDRYTNTTNNLLVSIIKQLSLRKLEIGIEAERMSNILWPINCKIQYLVINNGINMKNLYRILQYSPHLQTLNVKQSFKEIMNNNTLKSSFPLCFRQLTSLTIQRLDATIDELELFLSLTPSLVYLKLIGGPQVLDGKRWEQFIERNLSELDKFEFYFYDWKSTKQTKADLELIIVSFQTPFWIERKKWFVTCECHKIFSYNIYLYSLPLCKSSLTYETDSQKISLTTYTTTRDNNRSMMDNINSLYLTLEEALVNDIQEKKATTTDPLFPKVTEIYLQFRQDWPLLSLQSLSIFVDISRIVHMKISSNCSNRYNENTWMDMGIFMEQAHNLSSLIIQGNFHEYKSDKTIKNIYSILPCHVKQLRIPVNDLNQLKIILERCENLTTITFDSEDSKFIKEIVNWFAGVGEFSAREFSARNVQHGIFSTGKFSTRNNQHKDFSARECSAPSKISVWIIFNEYFENIFRSN